MREVVGPRSPRAIAYPVELIVHIARPAGRRLEELVAVRIGEAAARSLRR